MNIRTKGNLLSFLILPIGFFALGFLGTFHWIFIFLAILYFLLLAYIIQSFRCPNCQYPLGKRKYKIEGEEVETRFKSAFTKTHCDNCGYKF